MSGDGCIRCVTLHLPWPLCGSKGNSALRELFLILGGNACVAPGIVGTEEMEDAGVRKQKRSVCGDKGEVQVSGGEGRLVSGAAGLVAAAGIQPRAPLGAYKPLHWVKMNGNTDIQYAPIHAYT